MPCRARRPPGKLWLGAAALALLVLFAVPSTSCSQRALPSERPADRLTHSAFETTDGGPGADAPAERAGSTDDLATVHGLVVDSDGEPLEAVLVTIQRIGSDRSGGLAAISHRSTGRFQLELPPGAWRLYFHRIGYRPATVQLVIRSAKPVPRLHVRLRDGRGPAPVSLASAPEPRI